ncbi:MAG: relaxase/mobilization nuclease domain-containing protein [Thainema sp.]
MIGNVTTSNDFQKTTRYICRAGSQQVYANFGAAVTNDANWIAQAMASTAQQGVRVEKPCYHISISPSPKDELCDGDWYRLTEDFLGEMGLADRQAVGWLHHDATFPDGHPRSHLHLVINRVGELGQTYSTAWDYRKVDRVLRHLEASYQLDSVRPASEAAIRRDTPGQIHRVAAEQAHYHAADHPRSDPPEPSIRRQLQSALDAAIAQTTSPDNIVEILSQQGIETQINDRGWSFAKDGVYLAGNQLGRRYSLNSVEQMVDQQPSSQAQSPKPNQQPDQKLLQSRQRQRRLTMQEIMQESSEAQAGSQQRQRSARSLNSMGQHMMRDSDEVDGLTFIGGAIATAGAAVEIGEAFSQQITQARAKAEGKRAIEQVKKLEEIGDRTTALENTLVKQAHQMNHSQRENQSAIKSPENTPSIDVADSPAAQSLNLANERLMTIGKQLGVELAAAEPIELDPTAPTGKQLDQMDKAIAQLDKRLGTLEEAVAEITQMPEPTFAQGADIAQSLEQFIQSRTQFRGETEPSTFISSAGVVTLTREGFQQQDARLTITDADYGTVFEAVKPVDRNWEAQINELQPEQAETITQLPQSVEAYSQYKQGQQIVSALQSLASGEFENDHGQIDWSSRASGFRYRFNIKRHPDSRQEVTGRDANSDDIVFNATISRENNVFVAQNNIPNQHSNELLNQREPVLTPDWELSPEADSQGIILGIQPQPSRQRELEL